MQGQMPSMTLPAMQMPTPGYQPYPPMKNDCGCGGPKPFHHLGGYGVQPGYHPSQMLSPITNDARWLSDVKTCSYGVWFSSLWTNARNGTEFWKSIWNVSPYGYGFEPEIQEQTFEEGSEYNG